MLGKWKTNTEIRLGFQFPMR